MPQRFANSASVALATAVGSSDTTITLPSGAGGKFPVANAGTNPVSDTNDWFKAVLDDGVGGREIIYVRTRSGDVLSNILRGQEGTTARSFPAGSVLALRITADDCAAFLSSGASIEVLTYDQRAQLRTMAYADGRQVLVRDLGLFVHVVGSTEPDDDESCFATSTGRWLLEAPHWDVVDAWQTPEIESAQVDEPEWFAGSFDSRFVNRVLFGTATCGIASVAATSQVTFTGTVTGAAIGDRVIVNPPAMIGADTASNARLAYHAWVSAPNTVTIAIVNPSASSASISVTAQGAWHITVLKP